MEEELVTQEDGIVHISEATTNNGKYTKPYSIGYDGFEESMLGGVREGDLVLITGLSGSGKTTFAQCLSVNMSNAGLASTWFSYEVTMDNLYAKFKSMSPLHELFLVFTPKQNTTGKLDWVFTKILEAKEKYNARFVFIDHLDFLSPTRVNSSDQKRMIIEGIVTELKSFAIANKITIFLLAHVKKVQGRDVEMQDISESSAPYKLCDFMITVDRTYKQENIDGQRVLVVQPESRARFLKNRLTGQLPVMTFILENNVIVPKSFYTT
jgi:archaellum biogenesis ATPase FlaH